MRTRKGSPTLDLRTVELQPERAPVDRAASSDAQLVPSSRDLPVDAAKHCEVVPTRVATGGRHRLQVPLDRGRLVLAKAAFTTRRVPLASLYQDDNMPHLVSGAMRPRSGDLVLARVERLGQHRFLELASGRRSRMHIDDEILVAYGDRYAPDQFEAHVPSDLGRTHLVASGGIASTELSRCGLVKRATDIAPIGLVCDHQGSPLNLSGFGLSPQVPKVDRPRTLAVLGTSMNSGKTTTVQSMVLGLRKAGELVGATKVTGTGSGADYWVMVDAGAHQVLDFTDVGLASTYRIPFEVVEANFLFLVEHLTNAGCTAILIEVADGLYQPETAQLITSEVFRGMVDGIIFAAGDAAGAAGGTRQLLELGLPVVGVSGVLTRSPLAHREAAGACEVPVFTKAELSDAVIAPQLFKGRFHPLDLRRAEAPICKGPADPMAGARW